MSASFDPNDHLDIDGVKVASSSTSSVGAFSSVVWGHLRGIALDASIWLSDSGTFALTM